MQFYGYFKNLIQANNDFGILWIVSVDNQHANLYIKQHALYYNITTMFVEMRLDSPKQKQN